MAPFPSRHAHFIPSPELLPRYVREARPLPNVLGPELRRHLYELDRKPELDLHDRKATGAPLPLSLISSVNGDIRRMLLTIPAYAVTDKWIEAIFKDLIAQLPTTTSLVIVTENARVKDAVLAWPHLQNGTRCVDWVVSTSPLLFSIWAEDAYVAAADGRTTYLIEPLQFFRYGDAVLAELVAKQGIGIEQMQAPIYLQGGNILIGENFALIGEDYADRMGAYVDVAFPGLTGETVPQTVERIYKHYLGGPGVISYVGTHHDYPIPQWTIRLADGGTWIEEVHAGNVSRTAQPIFHIDMFVTLAGRDPDDPDAPDRNRVLVGDPELAAQILGVDVWPEALTDAFNYIAEQLADLRYHVIRNPLPMAYYEYQGKHAWPWQKVKAYSDFGINGADEVWNHMKHYQLKSLPARAWYFASANNALVQWKGRGASDVWLPTYGHESWPELAKTDAYNRKIWEDLGYTVHMLTDYHPIAVRGGAAHCIKKYLARG